MLCHNLKRLVMCNSFGRPFDSKSGLLVLSLAYFISGFSFWPIVVFDPAQRSNTDSKGRNLQDICYRAIALTKREKDTEQRNQIYSHAIWVRR